MKLKLVKAELCDGGPHKLTYQGVHHGRSTTLEFDMVLEWSPLDKAYFVKGADFGDDCHGPTVPSTFEALASRLERMAEVLSSLRVPAESVPLRLKERREDETQAKTMAE